jgi:uncharacterized protein (UPF0548 family)
MKEHTMFSPRKPSTETLRRILDSQASLELTYPEVGATAAELPTAGYVMDHTRAMLGQGEQAFADAKAALKSWRQYRFSWLEAWPDDTPINAGDEVATVARLLGLWWVNVCRIVYTIDEPDRFGYAYGTLPEHVECGEERFQIELTETGEVWYDIVAFSRPQHWLARVGYPYVRRTQKRFGRNSVAAMQQAVNEPLGKDAITLPR